MSGEHSFSQLIRFSILCRIELTFQVAMRISGNDLSDREAGAAATGRRCVRIDHPKRRPDQVVDKINLRAGKKRYRGRIDQHDGAVTGDHEIILGPRMLDVELVLKTGAAAAFHADP